MFSLQHLKLCLILFLLDFYLPCEERWAVPGKLALFFHFLVLNVFVSLMLRKHTLWLNFLSYKSPQCTSYPFLPVAKYFDLWRLGLLRESNKILANIISFFLHLLFPPFKKRSLPFIYWWYWKLENLYFQGMLRTQDAINPFLIFRKDLIHQVLPWSVYIIFMLHYLSWSSSRFLMELDQRKT